MSRSYTRTISSGHSRPLAELHFSGDTPDGVFLISACLDKKPMIRDAFTGDWIGTLEGHTGAVWSAKLNQDATLAVTGSADFTVRLWDATSGDQLQEWEHNHIVKTVAFDEPAARVVTGGKDKKLRVFSVEEREKPLMCISMGSTISAALFLPGDSQIAAGLESGHLVVLDATSGEVVRDLDLGGPVMDLEVSTDKSTLTVAAGKNVCFFNLEEDMSLLKQFGGDTNLEAASLRPDKKTFLSGGEDPWVHVRSFETGEELECLKGHHGPVHCLRYAPDGSTIASGANDATIRLWKPDEGAPSEDGAGGGGGGGGGGGNGEE